MEGIVSELGESDKSLKHELGLVKRSSLLCLCSSVVAPLVSYTSGCEEALRKSASNEYEEEYGLFLYNAT